MKTEAKLLKIRAYESKDRADLREICFQTGNIGKSANSFFQDAELFSDLFTLYYTDYEADSSWVVEYDQKIVGYLICSFQKYRFLILTIFLILPQILLRALFRGSLFKGYIWRIVFSSLIFVTKESAIHFASMRSADCHLHINIDVQFRGKHLGRDLLNLLFKRMSVLGLKGVTAGMRSDNLNAQKFFLANGFHKIKQTPAFVIPFPSSQKFWATTYGKELHSHPITSDKHQK